MHSSFQWGVKSNSDLIVVRRNRALLRKVFDRDVIDLSRLLIYCPLSAYFLLTKSFMFVRCFWSLFSAFWWIGDQTHWTRYSWVGKKYCYVMYIPQESEPRGKLSLFLALTALHFFLKEQKLVLALQKPTCQYLITSKTIFWRKWTYCTCFCLFSFRYTVTRYVEALGHFEAASSMYLNTLKFFYGNQKSVSYCLCWW